VTTREDRVREAAADLQEKVAIAYPVSDKEQEANQVKHLDDDYDKFFRSFTNIRPEGDQIERIETLRDDYKAVLSTIIALTNRTPERTIALRKLEESLMYAVKCIVLET